MALFVLICFSSLLVFGNSDDCTSCIARRNVYCADSKTCVLNFNSTTHSTNCSTPIDVQLNCPTLPKYAYDDSFMRNQIMVIVTAAQNENPQLCFDNQIPTMRLHQIRTVNCSTNYSDVTCVGYTAFDEKQKVIVISFKGAHGPDQVNQVYQEFMTRETIPFFDSGRVVDVFYNWFLLLWNGGMQQDLRTLKYRHPDFKLWVNGHSLGASLATMASSHIAKIGLFKSENMKVVTMGASPTGNYDFAVWHTNEFPYCFHIVHRDDPVTDGPMYLPIPNETVWHPRTRVWYDNYMKVGDPYIICPEADGYCSNTARNSTFMDHLYYFNIQLPLWGHAGCPNNISAYAQPEN